MPKTKTTPEELLAPIRPELLYTKAEAAEIMNVAPRFVERCVLQRRIRHVRIGKFVRIPASAIDEFIEAGTIAADEPNLRRSAWTGLDR